jgi:hypothetical protein
MKLFSNDREVHEWLKQYLQIQFLNLRNYPHRYQRNFPV